MEGWSEVCRIPATATSASLHQIDRPSITATVFDEMQNIVWCGDSEGYTHSFVSQSNMSYPAVQLYPYTRFKVTRGGMVLQHLSHKEGLLSLSNGGLNFNNRRGVCKMSFTPESVDNGKILKNLTCMTVSSLKTNNLIIGGVKNLMKIDLNRWNTVLPYDHEGMVSHANHSTKHLVLGKTNGSIELFDAANNKSIKTFQGHNGLVSDLDVKGNYIATCGYSSRQRRFGNSFDFVVDPLVNIYDLRMMKPFAPIPFPAGASFVRFHPKMPNILIISSNDGQIHFVDVFDQSQVHLYQADLSSNMRNANPAASYMSNLQVSDNGEFLCFGDGHANLHLWSFSSANKDFVSFPEPVEKPDSVLPPDFGKINVDDIVPLSTVGMPYYKDLLLSYYASDLKFVKETAKLPTQVETEFSSNLSTGFIPYDKLNYGPRNQYRKYERVDNNAKIDIPKFISERDNSVSNLINEMSIKTSAEKNNAIDNNQIFQYKIASSPSNTPTSKKAKNTANTRVPNCYSKIKIQYSKFGIEDFDFIYYNQTRGKYCGLENNVNNSYVNSLIQLYRFSSPFFNLVKNTLLHEWLPNDIATIQTNSKGSSVLNELGYLFDMMHKAREKNVKISNFAQVLNENRTAIEEMVINVDENIKLNSQELRNLIIRFNKFLINQVNKDLLGQFNDSTLIDMMTIQYQVELNGTNCQLYQKQVLNQPMVDLVTPPPHILNKTSILVNPSRDRPYSSTRKNINILTYLDHALNNVKTIPCQQHNFTHNVDFVTSVVRMPKLLSINVTMSSKEYELIQDFNKWLVPEFSAVQSQRRISLKQGAINNQQLYRKYELLGYVCQISHNSGSPHGPNNLVTFVKIENSWYLFNDFLVMPIPEEEVYNLSYPWKRPTIIMYIDHEDARKPFEYFDYNTFGQLPQLNASILYRDHFARGTRESYKLEYKLLTGEEAPSHGTLAAIDAEFVTLKPDEIEISYDGTKTLITPKHLSLARISVLRGDNGEKMGVPFIDDYILHTCEIHDYLTNFSGIEPGDLDVAKSEKPLVTLQTAYRRLWLLLNLGVVFVGHGLNNDFRCINLQVPQDQIRDTAYIFYKSDFKRKLSLKFLAYILLEERVQTGNHDSIEDARTALLLYKKYIELQAIGEFDSTLNRIYLEGQQLRFRVPET